MALASRWVQLHLLGGTTRCTVPSTWADPPHLSVNRFYLQRAPPAVNFARLPLPNRITFRYNIGSGFRVIAAHTNSPCLKLKPKSTSEKTGYLLLLVNVQTYGGGLWHTWFDRDLSVEGRVIL